MSGEGAEFVGTGIRQRPQERLMACTLALLLSCATAPAGCSAGIGEELPEELLYLTLLKDPDTSVTATVSDGFVVESAVTGEDLRTAFTTDASLDLTLEGPPLANVSFDGTLLGYGQPFSRPDLDAMGTVARHNIDVQAANSRDWRRHVLAVKSMSWEAYGKPSVVDADDNFGTAIAMDGEVLVVGATGEASCSTGVNSGGAADDGCTASGAAYVFRRTDTTWVQEAYIKASNPNNADLFGSVVAISGDTVAVTALFEDSCATGVKMGGDGTGVEADNACTTVGTGAVYVFRRTDGIWKQEAYIKASNTTAGAVREFGNSLSLDGDTLAVGVGSESSCASGVKAGGDGTGVENDTGCTNGGAVYVFRRANGVWTQEAYVKASNTDAGDWFGAQIALSGDTLVAGARSEDSCATGVKAGGDGTGVEASNACNGSGGSGAAYVFLRNGSTWQQQAYLKASDTAIGDGFGDYVALRGGTLIVAATGRTGNQGALYLFARSGTTWSQEAQIFASNPDANDRFGQGLALSPDGRALAAAANEEDSCAKGLKAKGDGTGVEADNSCAFSGAVYLFVRNGTAWQQQAFLKPSNNASGVEGIQGLALGTSTVVFGKKGDGSCATGFKPGGDGTGVELDTGCSNAGAIHVVR